MQKMKDLAEKAKQKHGITIEGENPIVRLCNDDALNVDNHS